MRTANNAAAMMMDNNKSENSSTVRTTTAMSSLNTSKRTTSSSSSSSRRRRRRRNNNNNNGYGYTSSHHSNSSTRPLNSLVPGESQVEQIAARLIQRRAERIPIPFGAYVQFLHDCRNIAIANGCECAKISYHDLLDYRNRIRSAKTTEWQQKRRYKIVASMMKILGMPSDLDQLLLLIDHAVEGMEKEVEANNNNNNDDDHDHDQVDFDKKDDDDDDDDNEDNWFYYRDFCQGNTKIISRWPWMRSNIRKAITAVLLFYIGTPFLFCTIIPAGETEICANNNEDRGLLEPGWISALYFASVTISGVGYGDLTMSQDPMWHSLLGSLYMLVATVVAVVAFTAAADLTTSPFHDTIRSIFRHLENPRNDAVAERLFLHQRLRRIKIVRLTEIFVEVLLFVLIGVVASQICVAFDDTNDGDVDAQASKWNWMTSFYWAIQTTTTIGYGDLVHPYGLRLFCIVYLLLATYVVGSSFGRLGSLYKELSELKRWYVWDHRPVTRQFVQDMKITSNGDDDDDKVDQYEFMVASLIMLGKIDANDLRMIMDKFRKLAGEKGYISVDSDVTAETVADVETADELEDEAIARREADFFPRNSYISGD